jgi:hypothetical protein
MLTKNLIFYAVAGTIVAVVAQALGASVGIVFLSSLVIPPALILSVLLLRYNGWL